MEWLTYGLLFLVALLVSVSAVFAFRWAMKNGQFRNFDAQARSIFDKSEPEGVQSDFFPGKGPRHETGPGAGSGKKHE